MTRYYWDKEAQTWVEKRPVIEAVAGVQIVRDIEPYTSAAVDKATGKPIRIGGRRQHREFLQRNGYREVGNDWTEPVRTGPDKKDVIRDLNHAIATGMTPEVRAFVERTRRS